MNNHVINKEKLIDIFIKICEKNQWQILASEFRGEQEYYLESVNVSKKNQKRHETLSIITPEEFIKEIDLFKESSINFRMEHEDKFKFLAGYAELSNINTVKNLKFFRGIRRDSFKKWESVLELLEYTNNELPIDDISIMLSKYHAKLSIKNYSNMAIGDLPDIFKLLNKCKKQDNHYNFHPMLSAFCANHLDQILDKINIKTFIFNKLKEFVPNELAYYKEFLQIESIGKDLFSDVQHQFKTFKIRKDVLFSEYPLHLKSPASDRDYASLLENATVFLNKIETLNKLNCNNIEMSGGSKGDSSFILTIETKENFNIDLIKSFYQELLQEATLISGVEDSEGIGLLKIKLKTNYEKIFNHTKLSLDLPNKENLSKRSNKL